MKKNKPDVFAAVGDPSRRKILLLLTAGALSMTTLAGNFGISRPAVYKHVKLLESAKLVSVTDKGRERFCMLDPKGFNEIKDWLKFYDEFWKNKLGELGSLLEKRGKEKGKGKIA